MNQPPDTNRITYWLSNSIIVKLIAMGLLLLILLIPAGIINSTINERFARHSTAVGEITSKWGGAQDVAGPVLTVPYHVYIKNEKGIIRTHTNYAYFLPSDLHVTGTVTTQIRYRGIYQAVLYQGSLIVQGHFDPPDFGSLNIAPQNILWKEAEISVGISDMGGIQNYLELEWNHRPHTLNAGILLPSFLRSGVSTKIPVEGSGPFTFSLPVILNGSDSLMIYPFGKSTTLELKSPWSSPSFIGRFLPTERQVSSSGFTAAWKVLQLNRNYPQQWVLQTDSSSNSDTPDLDSSKFGVELLTAVDQYQQTQRSTKYAVLFIVLTFGSLFFMEIMNGKSVHVFQYLVMGLAIMLFYSVLLSLAEHMGFGLSYFISSIVIITMITLYAKGIFASMRLTAGVAVLMSVLYAYLYTLLALEDYALLIGMWDCFSP